MTTPPHLYQCAWRLLVMRGLAGVVFGLLAFLFPLLTLFVLAMFFGGFACIEGMLMLCVAFRGNALLPRWWLALAGVSALAAGGLTFALPALTLFLLLQIIGFWGVIRGSAEIAAGLHLRQSRTSRWLFIVSGLVSGLFGGLLLLFPDIGLLELVWLLSAYSLTTGFLSIDFAFHLQDPPETGGWSAGAHS